MMDQITRRMFLGGLLSTGSFSAMAARPSSADVVVIGAGAAGLAASRTLNELGLSVITIDARDRIGGRAWTETNTFAEPFDQGCAWIDHGKVNPFKPMADKWGYTTLNHDDPAYKAFVDDGPATDQDWSRYDRAWTAFQQALTECGENGRDVSAASVSPRHLPGIETAEFFVGPATAATDLENYSCLDWYHSDAPEPHYLVKEGYGSLVAQYGRGISVRLNTVATKIDWQGKGVSVETTQGTIRAKACIITASTGILASGKIRFSPSLPLWKKEAIDGVPMGLLAKIALQFRGTRFGLSTSSWLNYFNKKSEDCMFLCWPFDQDLMIGLVGGQFAWSLTDAGEAAAVDFALGELRRVFGSDVDKYFVKGTLTQWGNDPWAMGAYAHARPGQYHQRASLSQSVGDRIFFAGEACAGSMKGTCGGAFLSGQATARELARAIKSVRLAAPVATPPAPRQSTKWWSGKLIKKFLIGTGMKLTGFTEAGSVWVEEYHADGTISGSDGDDIYRGRWSLKDDLMCWYYGDTLNNCSHLAIKNGLVTWWDSKGQLVNSERPTKAQIPGNLIEAMADM